MLLTFRLCLYWNHNHVFRDETAQTFISTYMYRRGCLTHNKYRSIATPWLNLLLTSRQWLEAITFTKLSELPMSISVKLLEETTLCSNISMRCCGLAYFSLLFRCELYTGCFEVAALATSFVSHMVAGGSFSSSGPLMSGRKSNDFCQ